MSSDAKHKPAKKSPKTPAGATGFVQTSVLRTVSQFILYVSAARWKEAIDFFELTIGLALRVNAEGKWAEFGAGGITFALHPTEKPAPKDTGLVFSCESCDEAVKALEARGVKITSKPREVAGPGSPRCFTFEDPFGNGFSGFGK